MNRLLKLVFAAFSIYCFSTKATGQFTNFTNGANGSIKATFLFDKIEVTSNKSFFNILTIKSSSSQPFSGKVDFSLPDEWGLVGEARSKFSLNPGDSVNIPIRIIVSPKVLGEIAYALVATVSDDSDRQIQTEYCFLTVPRKTDTKLNFPKNIAYISKKNGEAVFEFSIENKGNVNELVHIELASQIELSVNNRKKDKLHVTEFDLPANSDTSLVFTIRIEETDIPSSFQRLDISASTQDTTFKRILWLNKIDNSYELLIPENFKCAILELTVNDIFGNTKPSYSLNALGTILFKNNLDFFYAFQNNNLNRFNSPSTFLWGTNTRAHIGIRTPVFSLKAGNLHSKLRQKFYGIGGEATLKLRRTLVEAFYIHGITDTSQMYGASIENPLFNKIRTKVGYAALNNKETHQFSHIAMVGFNFSLLKRNSLSLLVFGNQTQHTMYDPYTRTGYAYQFNFNSRYKKFNFNTSIDFGSPESTGISQGRNLISNNLRIFLSPKSSLNAIFQKRDYRTARYINDSLMPERFKLYDRFEINHQYAVNRILTFSYGPYYQIERSNQYYTDASESFGTHNQRFFIQGRIQIPDRNFVISPRIDAGNILVMNLPENTPNTVPKYTTFNFFLTANSPNAGLIIQYRNGPFEINEQYFYHALSFYSKKLFVMPYYEKYFFNKQFLFQARANFQSDITNNTNVLTTSAQLSVFLPKNFSIWLINSFSSRSRRDPIFNSTFRYNSNYAQITLRKEFDCQQPRVKFHDLKVVFYRDLNGNRVKDPNEAGIENVLVEIENDYLAANASKKGTDQSTFISTQLLSDQTGEISYKNIPNGNYKIRYMLIGEMVGNFSREEIQELIAIEEDKTVYIPYAENNKIVGSVVLYRDPLSSLGPIDISNIRIIAEDTKGNIFSALTDKGGNFTLYTPVADHYIVKINNIFYESFDLQQSEFIVKFNGYKQFRVSFIFNEKKRKISFSDNVADTTIAASDIQIIRKTTLTGKIRDAITMDAVEAKIRIVDNKTNRVVSESLSNRLNGNYSISYVAGDNFRIEVKAAGYWEHSENLYIEQVISIQNIAKDILMKKLSDNPDKQTFIIYNKEEQAKFMENFKTGQKIPINHLTFDNKESRLSPSAYPDLDRLVDILKTNNSVKIEIAGHADDEGNERDNNLIASRRARAVAKYIVDRGIQESRIDVKSYSKNRPLVSGNDPKDRQQNRRVEIIVK
jgi:outer membrane protein OmpA-like peptidoglycan-associated protein